MKKQKQDRKIRDDNFYKKRNLTESLVIDRQVYELCEKPDAIFIQNHFDLYHNFIRRTHYLCTKSLNTENITPSHCHQFLQGQIIQYPLLTFESENMNMREAYDIYSRLIAHRNEHYFELEKTGVVTTLDYEIHGPVKVNLSLLAFITNSFIEQLYVKSPEGINASVLLYVEDCCFRERSIFHFYEVMLSGIFDDNYYSRTPRSIVSAKVQLFSSLVTLANDSNLLNRDLPKKTSVKYSISLESELSEEE